MSVTIRLSKIGKRNSPSYTVVASNTKDKRNGKFLDTLGYFNPLVKTQFNIDKEKFEKWVSNGAIVSNAVNSLIQNTYKYIKYNPKATSFKAELATSSKASAALSPRMAKE